MIYFLVTSLFTSELTFYLAHINAAVILHKSLLKNVLRLKMSFFDVNPIGRIMSRFSKDIQTIDEQIAWRVLDTLYCTGEVDILLFIFYCIDCIV